VSASPDDGSPASAAFLAGHGLPFSGLVTFNRAEWTQDVEGADLVVLGVPFDVGAVNRPGARFGPHAIRQQSVYASALLPIYPWTEDLSESFRIVDYGDVAPVPGSGAVESMLEMTQAAAAEVFNHGASLLSLGGDHTLPYGPVRAAAEAHGKLALVHLDSHQDSLDNEALPGPTMINHGTFATDLVREEKIDPTRSAQLYLRTWMDNPGGYTLVHAEDALELGADRLASKVRELVGDSPVYISIDLDSIDPAFAPGVGTPAPGGPSSREVRRFLRGLDGLDVVAADIVELNPPYDPSQITALLAAFLSFDLLHLMSSARRRRSADRSGNEKSPP
jgi:agmatinase